MRPPCGPVSNRSRFVRPAASMSSRVARIWLRNASDMSGPPDGALSLSIARDRRAQTPQSMSFSPRWIASASAVRRPSASCRMSAGAMRSGAFEPFTPETRRRWAQAPARRMNRQKRKRAQPVFDRGEDRRRAPRAGGSLTNRPPGARIARTARTQFDERRAGVRRRKDMRPRALRVGRDANRPALEERRVGDHASAASSASPASRRSRGFRTSSSRTRARSCKSVRAALSPASRASSRIDLDEIGERPRGLPGQREPDRADARADVDDPALRRPRRRGEEGASVPTRWPRFGWTRASRPPSHRSSVSPSAIAGFSSPGDGLSHRATLRRGPPRRLRGAPVPPRARRPESASAGSRAIPRRRPCAGRRRKTRPAPPSESIR